MAKPWRRSLKFGLGCLAVAAALLLLIGSVALAKGIFKFSAYEPKAIERRLAAEMQPRGLMPGRPLYLRIFKETSELEVWQADKANNYILFKSYPICAYSGKIGPKLAEGDKQAPEGFYHLAENSLNPRSRYHLAINVGYPNAYDRAHGRTGDFIMVHGNCVSIGCYAMGDAQIEEIYTLVELAFNHGQNSIPLHIFPFRLITERLAAAQKNKWYSFWQELAPAYNLFEQTRHVPMTIVEGMHYKVLPP